MNEATGPNNATKQDEAMKPGKAARPREASTPREAPASSDATKQCCARFYESDLVSVLLGESFHPGGTALTHRLGELLELTTGSHVLDVASGTGASAIYLAQQFGCRVTGIDYSPVNVERANAEAARLGLAERVQCQCADAEQMPLPDASYDAVICECAFCTFPDKAAAARQFARVLRDGGRVGLSDITRQPGPANELNDLMAWIACVADARPADAYAACLADARLTTTHVEPHDEALAALVDKVRGRLFAAEVLSGLDKLELPGVDFVAANRLARSASTAVAQGRLGYAIVTAVKS